MSEKENIKADLPVATEVSSDEDNSHGEWTDEDEKRIRRRMDVRIVPTVLILFLFCFIDR